MSGTDRGQAPRGAQPGNSNALKHGFYRRARLAAETVRLIDASREEGNSQDLVDLLRVETFRLVAVRDYDPVALAALARALVYAELAHHKIRGGDDKRAVFSALDEVLADVERARITLQAPRVPPGAS